MTPCELPFDSDPRLGKAEWAAMIREIAQLGPNPRITSPSQVCAIQYRSPDIVCHLSPMCAPMKALVLHVTLKRLFRVESTPH